VTIALGRQGHGVLRAYPPLLLYSEPMRDLIRKRLAEDRAEALQRIGVAVNITRGKAAATGNLGSGRLSLTINDDTKAGFAEYMDRSANFIRHLAPGSWAQYADELRAAGNKLKEEVMADTKSELRGQLSEALDKLINRKVEDFELGYTEGKDMTATTNNTVNIIGSQISNSVLEINQSGRDTISKETAKKLEQLVNSDEIKALPDQTRLDVLDQVSDVIRELKGPTDVGKVHRGLKRLGNFISSVASQSAAKVAAELAVAYARANGIPIQSTHCTDTDAQSVKDKEMHLALPVR
jgi:hypothetical protein